MRLRRNKNSKKTLEQYNDIVIFKPQDYKGKWREFFGNQNPIEVELGMGRGTFITEHAKKFKDKNFIGIDVIDDLLKCAIDKLKEEEIMPKNLALIPMNIENIEEVFLENELDRIYLNFSDPWPKARHAKRRLTHKNYLLKYKKILKNNSMLILKTDSRELFDFSVEEIGTNGFEIMDITYDLESINDIENIKTEYEQKFMNRGIKINRLKAILHK